VKTALARYRVMAFVTGTVLLTGVLVGIPLQIAGHAELLVQILWTAHGYLYLVYCVAAVNLAFQKRWGLVKTVLVLLAGTVPTASFFAEHKVVQDERAKPELVASSA
jgi:integral membrane protein